MIKTFKIKDTEYSLGGYKWSDENIAAAAKMAQIGKTDIPAEQLLISMSEDLKRMLHEAITDGESKEKADQAIADLRLNDIVRVFEAIVANLVG